MIKNTFYNLPPEKRERIIDVTKSEFLKGNKKKITINSVIERAGISRGSFYQYFDDKLDLVELVTDDMIGRIIDFIQDELSLNDGDIFELPVRIFDVMTVERRSDIGNLIAFNPESNQNSALISDYMQYRYRDNNFFEKIYKYIDVTQFENSDSENVECVMLLLFDVIKSAAFDVKNNSKSIESTRLMLQRKVKIIKDGALKQA